MVHAIHRWNNNLKESKSQIQIQKDQKIKEQFQQKITTLQHNKTVGISLSPYDEEDLFLWDQITKEREYIKSERQKLLLQKEIFDKATNEAELQEYSMTDFNSEEDSRLFCYVKRF